MSERITITTSRALGALLDQGIERVHAETAIRAMNRDAMGRVYADELPMTQYDARCLALEAEGLTRSDAQAVIDAADMQQ